MPIRVGRDRLLHDDATEIWTKAADFVSFSHADSNASSWCRQGYLQRPTPHLSTQRRSWHAQQDVTRPAVHSDFPRTGKKIHQITQFAIPCHPLALAIPKHPGGKLLAAAQIAKRILTERRKWRSFFQTCTPKDDQRWLSKDFMVPFRSISSPHPHPCPSLGRCQTFTGMQAIAILHATRPSPPWSPCLWLDFGSGCASEGWISKSWKFLGNKWTAFQKIQQASQTYIFLYTFGWNIWNVKWNLPRSPKSTSLGWLNVTNKEAFDRMHNSNSLFHLPSDAAGWRWIRWMMFSKRSMGHNGTC